MSENRREMKWHMSEVVREEKSNERMIVMMSSNFLNVSLHFIRVTILVERLFKKLLLAGLPSFSDLV